MWLDVGRDIVINAPRQRVWDYISDFRRHTEWSYPEHHLQIEPPREVRVGATFTSSGKELGHVWHNTVTITELVPGERLEFVSEHDGTAWRNVFALTDARNGTRLTKREEYVSARFPMRLLVMLLSPLLTRDAGRIHDSDLARIKTRLERSAEPA